MNSPKILEIAANSYASAIAADLGKADRIELFMGYNNGGLTPSYSLVEKILEDVQIPVMLMIRVREGGFDYSNKEVDIMVKDIEHFKNLNVAGFVFGALTKKYRVDKKINKTLLEAAGDKPCTFHRAFDFTKNAEESLDQIIELGFKRILTSGHAVICEYGIEKINKLIEKAKDDIIIMPGSGIHSGNIKHIAETTMAKEFHSSAKVNIDDIADLELPSDLTDILNYTQSDRIEIEKLVKNLKG